MAYQGDRHQPDMNNDIEDRFYSCSLDENLTTTEEYQASEDANKLLGQGTTHQPELYKIGLIVKNGNKIQNNEITGYFEQYCQPSGG